MSEDEFDAYAAAYNELPEQPETELGPSARSLDLEYMGPPAPVCYGLEVSCTNCGHPIFLNFDVSLRAFETLVAWVATGLSVSKQELLAVDGKPSSKVHQARALLLKALSKIAGEDVAHRWLAMMGWEKKRIHAYTLYEEEQMDDEVLELLDALRPSMLVDAEDE